MDNRAFQALVREQTSLKKVARDAVDDEFRRKNKRRKGGGKRRSGDVDSSDDDEDGRGKKKVAKVDEDNIKKGDAFGGMINEDDEDLEELETEIKDIDEDEDDAENDDAGDNEQQQDDTKATKKQQQPAVKKYRDRAKERREGKTAAIEEHEQFLEESDDRIALSKYLGGDEEHTHLVKGLDTVLANKVKREMRKKQKPNSKKKKEPETNDSIMGPIETKEEAMTMLKNYLSQQHRLDPQWHDYVEQFVAAADPKYQPQSTRGIGNMDFIFVARGDVSDIARSWETPQLVPGTAPEEEHQRATPLDGNLISRIEEVQKKSSSKIVVVSNEPEPEEPRDDNNDDGSDDDDIFGDAGDYVPPQAAEH